MNTAIGVGWASIQVLKYVSLLLMLGGVVVFGRNLFLEARPETNGDSSSLSPAIWRSGAARTAFKLFAAGMALLVLSVCTAALLPNRT